MRYLLLFIILFPVNNFAQELSYGDSSIVTQANENASGIYNDKDTVLFFLSKNSFIPQQIFAANICCYIKQNRPNRIVISYTTTEGLLSKEFFLVKEALFYCYETLEYFDFPENKDRWKNFKNIPAYESRYYFNNEKLLYQQHTGVNAIPKNKEQELISEKEKLLQYIKARYK